MIRDSFRLTRIISKFFSQGHERSLAVKKNIAGSFVLKGVDLGIGFIRVSIILSFVSATEYGIWLTVSSFVAWFAFLDIGLGNGLLNKLTEAISKKDLPLARNYLSTAYFSLSIIMASFFIIFLILFQFVNWQQVIAPNEAVSPYMPALVFMSFAAFALQSVLSIISTVLKADQKYAFGQSIGMIGSVIYFILLIVLNIFMKGDLLILALIAYIPPVAVSLTSTVILFSGRYKEISPSFKHINLKYFGDLARLGIKFFIIQIAAIVMFTTDNIIISQIGKVADVVPYNISRYYFGLVSMVYGLILAPLWPAFTDAYVKNDIAWIKGITRKIIYIWLVLIAVIGLMYAFADTFYRYWVGDKIHVPGVLSFLMGLSVIITSWNLPFVFFINGIGKIKLQLYNSIVVMIINVPLCIIFANNFKMGTAGIILSTCLCLFIGSLWVPVQYYKIINGTAKGIWAQ